jgi:hypothetical protein
MYNCNLFIWVNNCEFEHARSIGMVVHHKPLTFVLSNYLESLLCTSQQIIWVGHWVLFILILQVHTSVYAKVSF